MATPVKTSVAAWNWPMWWRILILINISFYNMMGNVFSAGITPLFSLLIKDFGCTIDEASNLASFALLMLGMSNLIALPAVEYVGKRYTILTSLVVFLASNIWAANANSYNSLLGSRFLGGFSGGVVEALGPSIVSECFHEHQLGRAMVVYVGFLAAGSAAGPIMAGGIASGLGNWRWFFGVCSIAIGINIITCLLMLPETTHTIDDHAQETATERKTLKDEKDSDVDAEYIESATGRGVTPQSLMQTWHERSFYTRLVYVKPRENPLKIVLQPFPLLLAPPVLITTLIFGLNIGWTVSTSVVVSNVFSAPPWLWQPWQVGFLNFGSLIGISMGLPLGGAVADMISRAVSKRSSSGHDPRKRLPIVILGGLVSPAGCILLGFALQNHMHWIWVSVGWGMLTFGLTASANVMLTYAVDCFRAHALHVGVLVNVVKNSIAFGVSFASVPWYTAIGPLRMFSIMAGLSWAAYLFVIPAWLWSRTLVRWSEKTLHL